ncbi:MAG: polysaccharide biosynthesis protein, partial [Candidatus Bathyarchaeia archaeon]
VLGTQNLIDVAIEKEVSKVIFASSDKAVNPSSVMGSTKKLCERLVSAANYYRGNRKTVFASVRFGNVIGSRGSVVPLFEKQIREGGPLTITDLNMTRFVMSMHQALKLLFKATEMAQCGEVFVFKMPAIKISDLAEVIIEELAPKYGYKPCQIKIKILGRRPGEKLHEELMTEEEANHALEAKDMFIVLPEMKELFVKIAHRYPNTRPTALKSYRSGDAYLLKKEEIKKMLKEGYIIES